jgi:hypothetical protein
MGFSRMDLAHMPQVQSAPLAYRERAFGGALQNELLLQHYKELWITHMVRAEGSKESRLHSVQGIFSQGLVWAPNRSWADLAIDEIAKVPFGKYDDVTDSATCALRWLRDAGHLEFEDERLAAETESARFRGNADLVPLYPV